MYTDGKKFVPVYSELATPDLQQMRVHSRMAAFWVAHGAGRQGPTQDCVI